MAEVDKNLGVGAHLMARQIYCGLDGLIEVDQLHVARARIDSVGEISGQARHQPTGQIRFGQSLPQRLGVLPWIGRWPLGLTYMAVQSPNYFGQAVAEL